MNGVRRATERARHLHAGNPKRANQPNTLMQRRLIKAIDKDDGEITGGSGLAQQFEGMQFKIRIFGHESLALPELVAGAALIGQKLKFTSMQVYALRTYRPLNCSLFSYL